MQSLAVPLLVVLFQMKVLALAAVVSAFLWVFGEVSLLGDR